ncbi:hypothetical protein EJ05DRAFT_204382 [Pseudovirgaria hyperparasitica]|uniref:Apoptosis-inducing TAF9-like domain 1 family protein n=1 Tax=Pseudovirgaria hyperparasitica TaxID=470096 RepID=A0A6A6WJX0_9PEZI|nr:uncharacterized protein EJ05DRAFT_204382 [Pseudovirgaria hyperparasitica]KAF2762297.1 hypothetical protein EJ05DRAFT_204382 [Pseudovirgaria hyperparasitica]
MADLDPATEERLKAALWYHIGQFVDEECLRQNFNATPQFIGALTELVWAQIANASKDLETFAKHAGRSTVNTTDVLLLARRNEGLESLLHRFVEDLRVKEGRPGQASTGAKSRGKGTSGRGASVAGARRGRGRTKMN